MENKDFEPIIDWSGYQSPIDISFLQDNVQKALDEKLKDDVYHEVLSYGIEIDKEGLIDAVQGSKRQYKEGFKTGWTGMMDALKDVVRYNGLSDLLKVWVSRGDKDYENGYKYGMKYVHCQCNPIEDKYSYGQLELIWMLCVILFGDYGTSPRSGWIENWPKCKEFLLYLIDDEEDLDD